MGAIEFAVRAEGATVEEAFNSAVARALYSYGHSGYTGSIAEKDYWVMVSSTPMTLVDAAALGNKLVEDEDSRVYDKDGPAGVIALADGAFYFFGWAAS
jgi:hypothetical protein